MSRTKLVVLLAALAFASTASAQPPYAPPDRDLWEAMAKALADMSMPLATHQQVQNILQQIQKEAQNRAKTNQPEWPK